MNLFTSIFAFPRTVVARTISPIIFFLAKPVVYLGFLLIIGVFYLFGVKRYFSTPTNGKKPRLFWGITPLINFKYSSAALRAAGYESRTVAIASSPIYGKSDFDHYIFEVAPLLNKLPAHYHQLLSPFFAFANALANTDIYHFTYDGGILSLTPLWQLESHLIRLFNKKIVILPYGSDVHVPRLMRNSIYKFGQMYHYGRSKYFSQSQLTEKKIQHFSKNADFCMGTINFDSLIRWDMLPVSYLSIDTNEWSPTFKLNENDGKNGPVTIVHSPNHRIIKGTDYILAAVERLKSEGYAIDFQLLERLPNTKVRESLRSCDILVELLVCGYGLSGVEGMALGKPVISNFQTDTSVLKYYSYLNDCPIVLADHSSIYEKLKWLIENPQVRSEIGKKSHEYVLKYHSYLSQQIIWGRVYDKIWFGENIDLLMFFHPLEGEFHKIYSAAIKSSLPLVHTESTESEVTIES